MREMNFEEVDQFVYLGALITNKFKEVRQIDARLSKANRMNFEEVDQFVYLGALITNKCEEVREIDARLNKANRVAGIVNYLLREKLLSRTTKFKLYKIVNLMVSTEASW